MSASRFPIASAILSLGKEGNAPEEYEDAAAIDLQRLRFAVADGATESSQAAPWARLLAQGFLTAPEAGELDQHWLGSLRKRWSEISAKDDLPWFLEAKLRLGAFATLLGLQLNIEDDAEKGAWTARAVGDCCLVHLRDNRLQGAFPSTDWHDYAGRTDLICSIGEDGLGVTTKQQVGQWQLGDDFFLMTDALAQWTLRSAHEGAAVWTQLRDCLKTKKAEANFVDLIDYWRGEGMRNDDVTLLAVCT